MNNIMIDLVSISGSVYSPLLAVEAVCFDPLTGELGEYFYTPVDIRQTESLQGKIDIETVLSWVNCGPDWLPSMALATTSERDALTDLCRFLTTDTFPPLYIWFNDPTRKLALLDFAIDRLEMAFVLPPSVLPPSAQIRCLHTLIDAAGLAGYLPHPRCDDAPYTLTDAVYQAGQVCRAFMALGISDGGAAKC